MNLFKWWWIHVFLRSFTHYIVLPAMLLLIVVLLLAPVFKFGAYIGIPEIVEHSDPLKRAFGACAMGILWLTVIFCGYLLWLKDLRDGRVIRSGPELKDMPACEAQASFPNYAWAISWRFVATVLSITALILGFQFGLPYVANFLGGPQGAWELGEPPWMVWSVFALTVAMGIWTPWCVKRFIADEKGWRAVRRWGRDWGWDLTLIAFSTALVLLAWYNNRDPATTLADEPSIAHQMRRPALVTLVFALGLFARWWEHRHWRDPQSYARFLAGPGILSKDVCDQIADRFDPGPPSAAEREQLAIEACKPYGETVSAWNLLWVPAIFALAYIVLGYLFSLDWVLGWAAVLLFVLLSQLFWRIPYAALAAVRSNLGILMKHDPNRAERNVRSWSRRWTQLGIVFFLLICTLSQTNSSMTYACFLWFGMVLGYGLLSQYLHRAMFFVAAALVTMLIASGVQIYHFRFPGLSYKNDDLVQLSDLCQSDKATLQTLDDAMADYNQILKVKKVWRAQEELEKSPLDEAKQTLLRDLLADPAVKKQRDKFLQTWRQAEDGNLVVPARQPPPPLMRLLRDNANDAPLPTFQSPLVPIESAAFDKDGPVVVISISGGGIRSAAWAFVVLKQLEMRFANEKALPKNSDPSRADNDNARHINFPSRVRLITGASGGMLGASYYVELLTTDPLDFAAKKNPDEWKTLVAKREALLEKKYRDCLTKDALTPITHQLVLGDLPSLLSPWASRYDRGRALEDAWKQNLEGALDRSFDSFRAGEITGKRPFLVFAPMLIEDGRRLLISNLDLRNIVLNDGSRLVGMVDPKQIHDTQVYSREALELFRLFPKKTRDFKLSTAVRMSASFPFFSPPAALPTQPRRRVVDAGYYDNYGVSLAASWLFSARNYETFKVKTSQRFLLIQIRDTSSDDERMLTEIEKSANRSSGRAVDELTSPIEGLYNSRDGSSSFRNDGQLELLSQFLIRRAEDNPLLNAQAADQFTVATFELKKRAPLSWSLGNGDREKVWEEIIRNENHQNQIEAIVKWWKKAVGNPS